MESTRESIAHLLAEGYSPKAIADQLRLAGPTVSYHIERLRCPPEPKRQRRAAQVERARFHTSTREQVLALLDQGLKRSEIAHRLGLSKAAVSYHARRLGAAIDERGARRYDWEAIQRYYDEGHSVRDCVAAFGFSHESWHSAKKRGVITTRPQTMPASELFVAGRARSRSNLRRRILVDGLKPAACAVCGISEWRDLPLSLALHHVNGDRLDNRLENLELLCPNCHSQTDTYSGRNGHRRRGGEGPARDPG